MRKLTCLHCGHSFSGSVSFDELGWHSSCPECGVSFDVDMPEGRIKMFFMDDSDPAKDFADFYDGAALCSYYAFDNAKDFIEKWNEISEDPDSMWYWCYDGEIENDNLFCSGACVPNDIEIFMSYFFCNEDGISYPKAEERNPKYLYWIYDASDDRLYADTEDLYWDRKLVYQKRRNCLLYDAATNTPLIPQPTFYAKHLLNSGLHLAHKYIPAELQQ